MNELLQHVAQRFHDTFTSIVALTDAFCDTHLNDEYKQLSREMAVVSRGDDERQ